MNRNLVGKIYVLAWPVLVAQLAVMAYAVIDTIMTGRYGTDDLAAVGIGASIYFSLFVGLMGVLLAVTPTVAHLYGARRDAEIGEQVRQSMWLAMALAAISVVAYRYPEPFLRLSDPPPAVAAKVRAYLDIAAWGAPAGLAFRLFASYTTAVSRPRVMMALNLMGLALKLPLNWMFIFGHWGAPEMGAAGCALATTLVNWLIAAIAWLGVARARDYRPYRVFERWSWPRWADQRHLLGLGVPIGGTFIVDVTAFTFMALFVARLGAVTSAAHQIAANVAAVMYMLPLATGTAVGVLVAQALGAQDFGRARSTGITGLLLGFGIAAISATLLALGADRVAALYSGDERVRDLAASLLVLVSGYHVFDALQAVNVNTLRGYKRAVVPLMINATGMWVVGLAGGVIIGLTDVPPLRAIGVPAPLGVRGFWFAAIVGMAVATLGIVTYFLVVSAPSRARAYADLAGMRATGAG